MHSGYSKHIFIGLLLTIAAIFMGLSPRPAQGYDVTNTDNLLAFMSTNSSSGQHSQAVDNLIGDSAGDNGLLFDPGDDQILAVSGFNSAIAVIRYYTLTTEGIRFPSSVSIKSSINPTVSLIATDYETDLGTFSWEATDFIMVPATGRGGDGYIDLYVSAPPGTQSLYFDFEGGSAGARVSEVQAFAIVPEYNVTHPDNLLAFIGTNSSSGEHSQAVDNLIGASGGDNGLLFGPGDDQILAVSGFSSTIAVIRYYTLTTEGIRFPSSVSIKSSINPTVSLIATDYETDLGTFLWEATDFTMVPATGRGGDGYIDLYVSTPPGTQSLYFDFEGGSAGARVSETQAFAPDTGCFGDFEPDGDVDGSDLAVFAADFGRTNCDTGPVCEGDFNNDNDVDGSDLAVFAADFGRTDCDFPVYFPDLNLEAVIREAISKPTGDIMYRDLQDLTALYANLRGIIELEGLQYCTNLSRLDIMLNQITDISALAGLVNLSRLQISSNQITDISALAGLVNLSWLDLSDNQITDISALADLVDLNELLIVWNQITDISALAGLVNLSRLDLYVNGINDISALAGLVNLSLLHLHDNQITDISALAGLVNLSRLVLEDNHITDISPLVNNIGIGDGDYVSVILNPLDSTSCIVHIQELISRGVTVTYDCD